MINTSQEPIWLIPSNQICYALRSACMFVAAAYRKYYVAGDKETIYYKIDRIAKEGDFNFYRWGLGRANSLVKSLQSGHRVEWTEFEESWDFPKLFDAAFVNYWRLVCLVLWGRGELLTPISLQMPVKIDAVLDDVCEFLNVRSLLIIRGLHAGSRLNFVEYPYKDNGRRASFWFRFLQNTAIYNDEDFSAADIERLCEHSYGPGTLTFRYHDTHGFLETIYRNNIEALDCLNKVYPKNVPEDPFVKEEKQKSRKERQRRRNKEKCGKGARDSAYNALHQGISDCLAYASGNSSHDIAYIIENHFAPIRYRKIFDEGSALYEGLPQVVIDFYQLFLALFKSYLKYKNYEGKDSSRYSVMNVVASYLLVYLPGFFNKRDGDLENYPRTLNDFSSVLFITRDSIDVDGLFQYAKEPPMTLLWYMKKHAEICPYKPMSHYSKVNFLDLWMSYVSSIRMQLPSADQFVVHFGPGCYPRVTKSYGTSKKALPRKYFSAFISMLYSMEYLVEHLNYMAEGSIPGRVEGELVQPSLEELREGEEWQGIWGVIGRRTRAVDLESLNYTPIYYDNGKIRRFEYIPRFYDIRKYCIWELVGKKRTGKTILVERVIPNDVRLTQVMCETGFRQNHTIWLDVDTYDLGVDRSSTSALVSLQVATDKAHGAWTAIVSRHVIGVLDRQRAWYRACASESYRSPIWYNEKKNSKFGEIMPIFRRLKVKAARWNNYDSFPVMLLALKYHIEHTMRDAEEYELVSVVSEDGLLVDFDDYSDYPEAGFQWKDVSSSYSPHGLRAAFITDALNFLPPSIVGQFFTGQTEELVLYYQIIDGIYMPSHQGVLIDYLNRNLDKYSKGDAPEIAESIFRLSGELAKRIKQDVPAAIEKFGLISLQGTRDNQNGMDILLAEKFTELAYNSTHICPFGNKCPVEVVRDFGYPRPCAVCPYAIRGVMHLPAISAEKDKYKELVISVVEKIKEVVSRNVGSQDIQLIENLNSEHDYYAREACALEASEQQLYKMHQKGESGSFVVKGKAELVTHFEKVKVSGSEGLMKRLVDTLAWPNVTSPKLDLDFAHMRARLLMHDGKLDELLNVSGGTPASQLSGVVKSMVDSGALDVMDLVRFGNDPVILKPIENSQMLIPRLEI